MISCPICKSVCRGHSCETDSGVFKFQNTSVTKLQQSRDGLQPKVFLELQDGSRWMAKYDRFEIAYPLLNEWMTMRLVRAAGFECSDYGLAQLVSGSTSRAALLVKVFDLKDSEQLLSGLQLLKDSPTFAYKVESILETTDPEEFEAAFHGAMMNMLLVEAVKVFYDSDVADMQNVFRFFVMAEALNHTDCHLGNIGFIYNRETNKLTVSSIYDVGNFGVYGESRDVLRASETTINPDCRVYTELARICSVDDWEHVIRDLLQKLKVALPEVIREAKQTTWINDLAVPDTSGLREYSNLSKFFTKYSQTLEESLASIECALCSRKSPHAKAPRGITR